MVHRCRFRAVAHLDPAPPAGAGGAGEASGARGPSREARASSRHLEAERAQERQPQPTPASPGRTARPRLCREAYVHAEQDSALEAKEVVEFSFLGAIQECVPLL